MEKFQPGDDLENENFEHLDEFSHSSTRSASSLQSCSCKYSSVAIEHIQSQPSADFAVITSTHNTYQLGLSFQCCGKFRSSGEYWSDQTDH